MPRIHNRAATPLPVLDHLHPVLNRVYSARGITSPDDLELTLQTLLPYHSMSGISEAVAALVPVVTQGRRLLVVGDFDADGATSTAVALRALAMMGATDVGYLVPNRFDFGYGLTPELVDVARHMSPDLIMTVDNGIAALQGVAAANAAGIPVVVTDHHLAGDQLPEALAIVNPNQPGCEFPSKAACGCTVVFYLMLALRAELQRQGAFPAGAPNLAVLIDLVALATVADVVPLDRNNRILVEQGLRRIRAGQAQAGVRALLQVSGRSAERITAADFGFALGPRINAAGRLDDMSLGIECLLTDDEQKALTIATELDAFNRERRQIEQGMQQEALALLDDSAVAPQERAGVCLWQENWHQGVIGILASRIKEKVYRPVIAFASADNGELKGSARSVPGLHIRDALDLLDRRHPGLIVKFGGHAMAAGLTLRAGVFDEFAQAFDQVCRTLMSDDALEERIDTDGELRPAEFSLELAEQLRWGGPWGQGFPEPVFEGWFRLVQQRIVGERHLKMVLQPRHSDLAMDAIWFNIDTTAWPDYQREEVHCVFQLDVNEFRGARTVQLLIRHLE
ncbi:single-stranded-DNA-specific exonuclease RecJ [uncultured Thalassolituus sp.]|mgnify:CR=1 FL=1|uniref:single-stranded-DNA-specific exonuclease RecJ n=1 Tax=uncultured Thalassolituus sp. TaxID=285273 RepID=UPI0026226F42|nr:single-stranded-DNA-specific exonuclease RecJ [uncultured Thalassolituus sp.]